jgi:hypothetical protein
MAKIIVDAAILVILLNYCSGTLVQLVWGLCKPIFRKQSWVLLTIYNTKIHDFIVYSAAVTSICYAIYLNIAIFKLSFSLIRSVRLINKYFI